MDVGCGEGSLSIRFGRQLGATRIAGIEISEDGVAEAKKKGIDARKTNLDHEMIPFGDSSFDFVLCSEVIEHLFDPDHLLLEIKRVLKPEGRMLLTTPNIAAWYDRISLLLGYQPMSIPVSLYKPGLGRIIEIQYPGGREHIRFFTAKALIRVLTNHGFVIDRFAGWMKDPPELESDMARSVVKALNRIFSHWPTLCSTGIILCRKYV